MDWNRVVFRITGSDKNHPGQGTGFAFGRAENGAVLLATCWHVVRAIQPDRLCIDYNPEWPCRLVSNAGDDDLDLAVLQVQGLACGEPLALAPAGDTGLVFETYGYEPVGRPLSGTLGAPLSRSHVSHQDVTAWDYYLRAGERVLEKIKDGYSGAPVWDQASGTVVAVITHRQGTDKGFAIDIANLPRVYPPARALLAQGQVASDGEYATQTDNPLAKTLDHTDQLAPIRALLAGTASDRVIALVEACAEDWPSYLADHLYLDPWPDAPGTPVEATQLSGLSGLDDQEFWRALVKRVPHAAETPDEEGRRARVRGWINGADLRVLYLPVALEREGRRLPRIIRGVDATLAGLGKFAPGTRVLVLISCLRKRARPPFWWPLYARFKLRRIERCHRLHPLRLLEKPDVEKWYAGFPSALRLYYDCDRLRVELLDLFEPNRPGIRYEEARRRLIDEDALRRAQVRRA